MKKLNLNPIEKKTFYLLLLGTFFAGFIMSVGNTQDIIAKKALNAETWQLAVLTMIWPVSNLFSIWWGKLIERADSLRKFFIFAAFFGRLTLLFIFYINNVNQFILILFLMHSANSIIIPATNKIYQSNIRKEIRGQIFGITMSLRTLTLLVLSYFIGRLLDWNENLFRVTIAVSAICGFINCMILSSIKIEKKDTGKPKERYNLLTPLIRTVEILRTNKPFAHFQRNFTFYGMGFIMMQPALPIYLVDKLQLSYTHNFVGKIILANIGLLLLSPLLGKKHDSFHPFKFTSMAFGGLIVLPVSILISSLFGPSTTAVAIVFVGFFLFSIAMAGINMAWNMSSIHFAGNDDSSMYQSVHVTITALRGVLAPLLSLFLINTFGVMTVFAVAIGFLALASIFSYLDYRAVQAGKLVVRSK
ncbi:MAG: MFS transporter [Candidatus Zophobacter franzmannii]|nr:MFS transporter [Candidatus Zophobacter franzmannii]